MKHLSVLLIAALFLMLQSTTLWSDSDQLAKPSNVGKEFYCTIPPLFLTASQNNVILYFTSAFDASASIVVNASGLTKTIAIKKNVVNSIVLDASMVEPDSIPDDKGGIAPETVYPGWAIHVLCTQPCALSCAVSFLPTMESFSVLPVECLGKNYVCSSQYDMSWMYGTGSKPSELAVAAVYDSTTLLFTVGGSSNIVTAGGLTFGKQKVVHLNRGDVWIIGTSASHSESELSGSTLQSDKPIAVFDGNQCANVPLDKRWCNYIAEQETPIEHWGYHYFIPMNQSRLYGGYMKVYASAQNTKMYYNGSYWKTMQTVGGAPGTGWVYQRIDPTGNTYVTEIDADNPINVVFYNPGQEDDSIQGDPFQMNVVPVEQFTKHATVFAPVAKLNASLAKYHVGIVCALDSATALTKDLEVATPDSSGALIWKSFASVFGPGVSAKNIYTMTLNAKSYSYREVTIPYGVVYALRCTTPFMVYSYGSGSSAVHAYGQPAGYVALDLTKQQDTVAPNSTSIALTTLDGFSGTATDFPDDDAIRSNMSKIVLGDSSSNISLSVSSSTDPAPRSLDWTLKSIDTSKGYTANLIFVDRAGNSSKLYFAGSSRANSLPHISSVPSSTLCVGDTLLLHCSNASAFTSITWSTGVHDSLIVVTADTAQTIEYSISAINSSGIHVYGDTVRITFVARPAKPLIFRSGELLYTTAQGAGYQWVKDGILLTNEYKDSLVLHQTGVYSLVLSNGTCTTASDTIHVDVLESIESESTLSGYTLSPNPANSECVLSYLHSHPISIEVYNGAGFEVSTYRAADIPPTRLALSLMNFSPGVYTIRILDATGIHVVKFVRQ